MITVARAGPATQANDTIARVWMTSAGCAPENLRWANSSDGPTPAGAPITRSATTAIGSDVVNPSTTASRKVSAPQASIGRR